MNKEKYYSLTQTCERLKVPPYVLRYWEREFEIKVKRNSAGRRIYSQSQLDQLATIKRLLHEEKLTIKGARRRLAQQSNQSTQPPAATDLRTQLASIKNELRAIRALLEP